MVWHRHFLDYQLESQECMPHRLHLIQQHTMFQMLQERDIPDRL